MDTNLVKIGKNNNVTKSITFTWQKKAILWFVLKDIKLYEAVLEPHIADLVMKRQFIFNIFNESISNAYSCPNQSMRKNLADRYYLKR